MDLFGVVRRLAMGAAYYSTWGVLSPAVLRGGGGVSIKAVAAVTSPIAADMGAVFVSTKVTTHGRPYVLAALANAISGEGGTMYTDLLGVDVYNNVLVPTASNAALAQGCHEALRILGAQFRASGRGLFYALGVSQGVHRVKSVHGHSDEGAYVRDVFRAREAGIPYGAIVSDIAPDNAMPDPARSIAGFRVVYDGIALATAGAVALADPMVSHGGRDYPTVIVADGGYQDPGTNNAGDIDDAKALTAAWAEMAPAWAAYYARALGKIFVTTGGESEVVRHLCAQADSLAGSDNRHLRLKAAVAFCWIEPSCSCPVGGDEFPAFTANCGPLALGTLSRTVPSFDGCAYLEDKSDITRTALQIDFRYPRRHGLLVHLWGHARDGYAHITLQSASVENCLLVGGDEDLADRILGGESLDTYMWGRGHSTVVAVGEFMNLDKSVAMCFDHTENAGARFKSTHIPRLDELLWGDVTFTVSRLSANDPGSPGMSTPRDIARARSRAAIALLHAADAARSNLVISAQLMQPRLGDYGELPPNRIVRGVVPEELDADAGGAGGLEHDNSGVQVTSATTTSGGAAGITIENRSSQGPRPIKAGKVTSSNPLSGRGGNRGRARSASPVSASNWMPPVGTPGGAAASGTMTSAVASAAASGSGSASQGNVGGGTSVSSGKPSPAQLARMMATKSSKAKTSLQQRQSAASSSGGGHAASASAGTLDAGEML